MLQNHPLPATQDPDLYEAIKALSKEPDFQQWFHNLMETEANIFISPGFYARPLDADELAPDELAKVSRYGSTLEPVEIVRLYGEWRCPKSYGKFWDVQSAADFVNLNFN